MMFVGRDEEAIVFWDRFIYLGVVFMPAFQYHFSLLVTSSSRARKFLLSVAYSLSFVFLFFSRSDYFVSGVYYYKWGVHTIAQWGHHLFLAFFFFYIFALLYNFYDYYRRALFRADKYRAIYYVVSFAILNLFGGLGYLPAYRIGIFPISLVAPVIFSVLIAYAIVAHRLMDIKLVLRQSFVYIFSVLVIVLPAFAVLYYLDRFWPDQIIYVSLGLLILSVSVFPAIRNYYYRVANKYFFSSLYDGGRVIATLSDGLRSTLDAERVYHLLDKILTESMRVKALAILRFDAVSGQYIIQHNNGFPFGDSRIFPGGRGLRDYFVRDSKITIVEEAAETVSGESKKMLDMLLKLGVAVIAPLKVQNDDLGVIILGRKESGDMHNDEDLRVLAVIASQTAIAAKNVQLYDEVRGFSLTLQKEVERQTTELKQANEDLKRLDKAKSDFISIASHQLRTPLSAIKGFTSMILEGSYGRITEKIKDKTEKIYESTERLIRLVNDLLDLSHMEGGKMEYNFDQVDFDAMVKSVVEELRPNAARRNLNFDCQLSDEEFWVWADEQKLRQVVMNLVDNAIKYTQQGSVEVALERQGSDIIMSVKDTGMGMSQGDIDNLFQKFARGGNAARLHTEGAGIGLYVAKNLIEAQNGRVWAESQGEGKGSIFFVRLPERRAE